MCNPLPSWLREAGDSLPSDIPQNPFEVFELPVAFEVDREELDRIYRLITRRLHPDHALENEKQQAQDLSARVNRLVTEFKDPVRRAHLLFFHLSQRNLSLAEFKPSGAFLMEMFELQDEIEEWNLRDQEDRLLETECEIKKRQKKSEQTLKGAFEDYFRTLDLAALEGSLQKELSEFAYLNRVLKRVGEKLDE